MHACAQERSLRAVPIMRREGAYVRYAKISSSPNLTNASTIKSNSKGSESCRARMRRRVEYKFRYWSGGLAPCSCISSRDYHHRGHYAAPRYMRADMNIHLRTFCIEKMMQVVWSRSHTPSNLENRRIVLRASTDLRLSRRTCVVIIVIPDCPCHVQGQHPVLRSHICATARVDLL